MLKQAPIKQIHIASMNRSGASLLARLFDSHPDVGSYPAEFVYPWNEDFFPFLDRLTGSPYKVHVFDDKFAKDPLKFFGITKETLNDKANDVIGVGQNYLAREFYSAVKTDFDLEKFITLLKSEGSKATNMQELFDARHRAFFASWDDGRHGGNLKFTFSYGSGHLFFSNFDQYFENFKDSLLLCPIRNVYGYIASEKTRLARRFYGSRRFTKIKMPDFMVKYFDQYNLESLVRSWVLGVGRIRLFQERYGASSNFLVYRYENLLNTPETVLKAICAKASLDYDPLLLKPTIGGRPWGGSSHRGKKDGIAVELQSYYPKVLQLKEMRYIEEKCGPLVEALNQSSNTPTDLTVLSDNLFEYLEYQKKYFNDEAAQAMFYALAYRDRRLTKIAPPSNITILALIYRAVSFLIGIPLRIKQKLFPGMGRQNYT